MKEFDKIIGYNEIKNELITICDMLTNTEKYEKLGIKPFHGVLLHGVPGVGKTLFANCFIEATKRKCFVLRKDTADCDFVTKINSIFQEAKDNSPSIILLDDMDKFSDTDKDGRNTAEYVAVQSNIDNIKESNVFVIATANYLAYFPSSLVRVGRFDRIIKVETPKGRVSEEIIKHYLLQKNYIGEIDANQISRIISGSSCAQLESVINTAGIFAAFNGRELIQQEDIIKACLQVVFNSSESFSLEDNKYALNIAYHEAGHAVISEIMEPKSVNLISIKKHNGDIGGITSINQDENYFRNKKYMDNRVMMLLGGRAATEIVFGETDVGATSDITRAYEIVQRFVSEYCDLDFSCIKSTKPSDKLTSDKEKLVSFEIAKYYFEVKKLLIDNRAFLDKVANALIERETILQNDIAEIQNCCATCNI